MTKWSTGGPSALLLASLLMVAGCGDAGDTGEEDAAAAQAAADSAAAALAADTTPGPANSVARRGDVSRIEETMAVRVTLTEWGVTLSDSTITSGPVTLVIRNEGDLPHVVEIVGEYGGRNRSAPLPPGRDGLMSMNLSAGRYTVFCPRVAEEGADHRTRGMEARLIVR